jgi:hypothetical protein
MVDTFKPLSHHDAESSDDDTLRRDARAHLAKWPYLQVMAELVTKLRASSLPFWSPSFTREQWRPLSRMQWLGQRADLRQRITSTLCGLPRNAARSKTPEFQASLIDAVLDHGDVSDEMFEEAFAPQDLVVYGPVGEIWTQFRVRMPWEDDSAAHQKLVGWLLRVLTSDRSTLDADLKRKPILTAWDVRTAIDARVWQERIPLETRAAIDEARIKQERSRPREPFHARHELAIATPELIAQHIPLVDLLPVLHVAEQALFSGEAAAPVSAREGAFESSPPSGRVTPLASEITGIAPRPFAIAR